MKKKIAFKTLGCRLNQFETDSILNDFCKSGYEIVNFNEKADVYIVNTCTVTSQGDHKSRTALKQALKQNGKSVVIAAGCLSESRKEALSDLQGITYIVGNKNKSDLISLVEGHFKGEVTDSGMMNGDIFGYSPAEQSFHTRGMVKIQDGCDNFCSYCIVPLVRGRASSRPHSMVIDNVIKLVAAGYKEIVLTGVNISRYSYEGTDFAGLLEMILGLPGDFRLRISSIEPEVLGDHFFSLFSNGRLCQHLHLCIQSGSDRILSGMRRHYTVSAFMKIIEEIKMRYPLFNITTDIIVGFPGETEKDFKATCDIATNAGFSHIHTFKYSARPGTRASLMDGHVSDHVKNERSRIIRSISDWNKAAYRKMFLGKVQTLLVEKTDREGNARGYGEHYIPLILKSECREKNYFTRVVLKDIDSSKKDMPVKAEEIGTGQ